MYVNTDYRVYTASELYQTIERALTKKGYRQRVQTRRSVGYVPLNTEDEKLFMSMRPMECSVFLRQPQSWRYEKLKLWLEYDYEKGPPQEIIDRMIWLKGAMRSYESLKRYLNCTREYGIRIDPLTLRRGDFV